jgi:hypothetical protein
LTASRSSTSTPRSRRHPTSPRSAPHEALSDYLVDGSAEPAILCGDLTTPRRELADGEVLAFAHDSAGRLREERGERWHLTERALVRGLHPRASAYAHDWRLAGLSDHSALVADLAPELSRRGPSSRRRSDRRR